MTDFDDHVIPYEEAVRRHRALQEAQRQRDALHEVKISDAMSHLLEGEKSADEEGPSPDQLRRIVEREFADEGGRSRPRLVGAPRKREEHEDKPRGQLCDFKTGICEDPPSDDEPRD